jgi:hypothetical protein
MSQEAAAPELATSERATRLIWPAPLWPADDRLIWIQARLGRGPEGRDNPAVNWSERTLGNSATGYGRYLAWLHREGLLIEGQTITERIIPARVASYIASLKPTLSPTSVGMFIGWLSAAARVLAPSADWSWLSRRYGRLKLRAKPSRDKRHAIQHTLDLYRYGKQL